MADTLLRELITKSCLLLAAPSILICIQEEEIQTINRIQCTVCPGSSDPFYIVSYHIKRTTSWTYSMSQKSCPILYSNLLYKNRQYCISYLQILPFGNCPSSGTILKGLINLDPDPSLG